MQKIGTYLALFVPLNWAVYAIVHPFLLHLIHLRIWGLGLQVPPGTPIIKCLLDKMGRIGFEQGESRGLEGL